MSRVIKSSITQSSVEEDKIISLKHIRQFISTENLEENESRIDQSFESEKLLEEAKLKAEEIMKEANQQLIKIEKEIQLEKQNWIKEREQLIQEAYNIGFHQGEQEGKEKGFQEYSTRLEEASEIVINNKEQYYSYLENAEKVILSLGITCAEKIINQKITDDPDNFLSIIKRGLKEVRNLPEIQIHVHPTRHKLLIENKEELEVTFPTNVQCFIFSDDDLHQDECYIETNQGRIIVSIDSQLKELKMKLLDLLQSDTQ